MGRRVKEGVNRGAWSLEEDRILRDYINMHGQGRWGDLSRRAGLNRCGKSCRLRWLNYLRPGIKRGNFTEDEEDLIIRLHKLLGNRWSLIAGRLPGRTDNEIKNYWNTKLRKKIDESINKSEEKKIRTTDHSVATSNFHQLAQTKVEEPTKAQDHITEEIDSKRAEAGALRSSTSKNQESLNYFIDFNVGELWESNILESISKKAYDVRMKGNGDVDGHLLTFKEYHFGGWGVTQLSALDVADSSDENLQKHEDVLRGDIGEHCNIWPYFDQGRDEVWWAEDPIQVNGERELKV